MIMHTLSANTLEHCKIQRKRDVCAIFDLKNDITLVVTVCVREPLQFYTAISLKRSEMCTVIHSHPSQIGAQTKTE